MIRIVRYGQRGRGGSAHSSNLMGYQMFLVPLNWLNEKILILYILLLKRKQLESVFSVSHWYSSKLLQQDSSIQPGQLRATPATHETGFDWGDGHGFRCDPQFKLVHSLKNSLRAGIGLPVWLKLPYWNSWTLYAMGQYAQNCVRSRAHMQLQNRKSFTILLWNRVNHQFEYKASGKYSPRYNSVEDFDR